MTTENSRADALTIPRDMLNDLIDDVQSFTDQIPCKPREKAWRADLLARARSLAASPIEQPAAAPIEKCAGCHARCTNNPPDCYAAPSPADERAADDMPAVWHKARNAWLAASRHGTQEAADTAAIAVLNEARAGEKR